MTSSSTITSLYFWLAVVFVGLLINLASAYIKDPMDRAFGKVSKSRREKSERAREQHEKLIAMLEDREYRAYIRWRSQLAMTQSLSWLLLGLGTAMFAGYVASTIHSFGESPMPVRAASFVFGLLMPATLFRVYRFVTLMNVSSLQEQALHDFENIQLPPGVTPSERTDGLIERLRDSRQK